jgi:hypothetical protein
VGVRDVRVNATPRNTMDTNNTLFGNERRCFRICSWILMGFAPSWQSSQKVVVFAFPVFCYLTGIFQLLLPFTTSENENLLRTLLYVLFLYLFLVHVLVVVFEALCGNCNLPQLLVHPNSFPPQNVPMHRLVLSRLGPRRSIAFRSMGHIPSMTVIEHRRRQGWCPRTSPKRNASMHTL